jgi:predicted deacylase
MTPGTGLIPPKLERYRAGNCGIPFVLSQRGAEAGPHVMLTALVHGNEYSGAIALDRLLEWGLRPRRGRLTICFANVAAFETFDPAKPMASRHIDRDFNRLWSAEMLDGPAEDHELRRARQLRPLVDGVDFLLDLHSLAHVAAPLILCGRHAKGRRLAEKVGYPEWIVSDAGHAAGTRLRDYAGFDDPDCARNALLVECGQHWQGETVEVALDTTISFLRAVGTIDPSFAPDRPRLPAGPQRHVEVTGGHAITTPAFRFAVPLKGLEIIPDAGTLIALDGETEVRTPYDRCVIVMPSPRLERGTTAVRFGRLSVDADAAPLA